MASKLHVCVLAFPFGTHATPLLTIVRRLASSAPDTKFSFLCTAASNDLAFSGGSCDNILRYNVLDGIPEGLPGVRFFLEASSCNYEKGIKEAEEETGLKVSCLIADTFLWFACDLAEDRGVPLVSFWVGASCSLSAQLYTDAIQNAIASETDFEEIANKTLSFIPGLSKLQFSDLPPELFVKANSTPTLLELEIYNMVQKVKLSKSKTIILNCFEEIDPIITTDLKSKFSNFLNIGPLVLTSSSPIQDDKYECLPWLKNQTKPKSVIYISFGTVVTLPPNEIASLSEALEELKFPFLWSMRDHERQFLPQGFVERTCEFGKIVTWAPQLEVLRQSCVGVYISHSGWNSVLECISCGVPMIGRPFSFAEQRMNAKMVESSWRIGVRVKGGALTKSGTIEALNHIMLSEDGKEIQHNIFTMKEKAVAAVKLEGSSTNNFKKLLEIINIGL